MKEKKDALLGLKTAIESTTATQAELDEAKHRLKTAKAEVQNLVRKERVSKEIEWDSLKTIGDITATSYDSFENDHVHIFEICKNWREAHYKLWIQALPIPS